eukprot:scaffold75480_cov23-Tisochrysis_lutea.AAC.1
MEEAAAALQAKETGAVSCTAVAAKTEAVKQVAAAAWAARQRFMPEIDTLASEYDGREGRCVCVFACVRVFALACALACRFDALFALLLNGTCNRDA